MNEILSRTAHRPWPLPAGRWVLAQSWHDLLFAHWPVPANDLRPLVPGCLDLDTRDGSAWVGVVPFRMSGVRPRGLPPLPGLSRFPELNVRTYVRGVSGGEGDRPGVFFFSLDAANPVAVAVARTFFHLPYFRAEMSCDPAPGEGVRYRSRRTHRGAPPAEFRGTYAPAGEVSPAKPGTLEHFLIERYCLYAVEKRSGGPDRVRRTEIHHEPWPLRPAAAEIEVETVAASMGIPIPNRPPLLHFARRIDVLVWPSRRPAGSGRPCRRWGRSFRG